MTDSQSPLPPPGEELREKVARLMFERGRGAHDAPSWEEAGEEMQQWLLGHADAILALPELNARGEEVERLNRECELSMAEIAAGRERAEAAEARAQRLQAALEEIGRNLDFFRTPEPSLQNAGVGHRVREIIRAALKDQETGR